MEDLAVFTALNHSGSFGKNLVKFKKDTASGVFSRPRSQFFTIRTSQPANNIYILSARLILTKQWNKMLSLARARY